MPSLETTLDALETAKRRKKQLKKLLINLTEQYRLVKQEIELHKKRSEALLQEHEYSDTMDTMTPEKPSE